MAHVFTLRLALIQQIDNGFVVFCCVAFLFFFLLIHCILFIMQVGGRAEISERFAFIFRRLEQREEVFLLVYHVDVE